MQKIVGNNQDYLGNGLTKDINSELPNHYGVVETLNFERKAISVRELSKNKAITIAKGLERI